MVDRGSYVAASGGMAQLEKLDIVTGNLANVNTVGFKQEVIATEEQSFDDTLASLFAAEDPYARADQNRTPAVGSVETFTDFSQGPIRQTRKPLDVALRNEYDFFVVNSAGGAEYTRAGNFTLNAQGQLVTMDGEPVASDGGVIIANGANVGIQADGSVIVEGQTVGRLQVVRFQDTPQLERVGNTRFKLVNGAPAPQAVPAEVVPESLEMPNVNVVSAMVALIAANRGFELYSKSQQSIDSMNRIANDRIGKAG